MDVFEKVLSLRPTNAATRLGSTSRLPVLNPRDISRGINDRPLLCLWVADLSVLPGLLRAAREVDAVLGLASPYAPLNRDAPYRFVDALRFVAAEVGHERPVFLQAGPQRLASAEPRALQQGAEHVFRCLDAGFSLVSLDASRLAIEDQPRAYRELSAPAAERELAIEVTAPREAGARTSPDALEALLSQLAQERVFPRYVRVEARVAAAGASQEDARLLDAELMEALRGVATAFKAELTLEDPGHGALQSLSGWQALGARKIDAVEALGQIAARALPGQLKAALQQRADSARLPLGELLAQSEQFFGSVGPAARERTEALSFAEALDLLEALRVRGSATRCISFLASQSGY
jgi:hypothetical protein